MFFVGLGSVFCFLIVCLYCKLVSFIFFVSVFKRTRLLHGIHYSDEFRLHILFIHTYIKWMDIKKDICNWMKKMVKSMICCFCILKINKLIN